MTEKIITKKILKWYDLNKRNLPWRKKIPLYKKHYYTLVSEFMLQQTQVVTVIPFFNRFIKKLPSLEDLAKVRENELIKKDMFILRYWVIGDILLGITFLKFVIQNHSRIIIR